MKNFIKKTLCISLISFCFFRIEKAWWYSKLSYCFDLVFSISPRYIAALRKLHNCNVVQIYNGINLDIYKNYSLKRNKQIIAVANFKPQKGLKFLVSGFNKFIKKYPMYDNYKLIIHLENYDIPIIAFCDYKCSKKYLSSDELKEKEWRDNCLIVKTI